MATRTEAGVTFQEKDPITIGSSSTDLSNTKGFFPMVQDGVNYKATLPQITRGAVAVCSTAADSQEKTATINNMPDFTLVSGITVTIQFENTNSAENPTLNVNNTGAKSLRLENQAAGVSIGSGCWVAGAILECRYVEFGSSAYWLLVGHKTASITSAYTILSDNTFVYSKGQTDTKIDTEISGLSGANIQATYEGETDYINNVLTKVGKVKTVNEQEPDENGNIEIDADSTIPSMTTAEYDELTDAEKNDGHIREITDSVGTPIPFAVLNDELVTSANVYSAQKTMLEIAKTTTYSEEETVVGKWIDNKPIYRKVYKEASPNTWTTNSVLDTISDFESLVKTEMIAYYSNDGYICNAQVSNLRALARVKINGQIYVQIENMNRSYPITIILEYTKTTD